MKKPAQFFFFFFFFLSPPWCSYKEVFVMGQSRKLISVDVGVVLDFNTMVGKVSNSCMSMALSEFYESHPHYKTRLHLHTRDSKQDVVEAADAALDLIKNVKVQAIIGPESSMQADFIIDIGDKAQVPIVSFSATSPSLSSLRSPYFIRAIQNDSSQVKAISAIVQAFEWRQAVPIYVDNEYGEGVIPFLIDALQEIDTRVPYRSVISPSATDEQIVQELYKLMTMQTRVFIVHMLPTLGARLFSKAEEIGMMSEGYVWIITDGLGNLLSLMNSTVIDSMQGVLGLRTYIPNTKKLENFTIRWKKKFQQENPTTINAELDIFGLRATDAALALAMAAEEVGATIEMDISGNSTDVQTLGLSRIGPKLGQALSSSTINGLSGEVSIVDGQLQPSAFQIFNLIGHGARGIGFWTPENGISRKLKLTNRKGYDTSNTNLGSVIWPGDPKYIPSWIKKMRIGVPVKKGFNEFVKVTQDDSTNTTIATGYCIDVFKAVKEVLPYNITYDLIPFEGSDGKSAGTYDDLVYQVYLQKYDGVVGDVTIRANRSLYADFSLPYTESGVSMIVPVKDDKQKKAWVFLKPLTRDLWVTSACFFVFIGCVIWVLEHRINKDFRGPASHQAGTILWFSFSTMVFAHKEKVVSNLARFVVIIWFFVVLILTQSYTASLTSMLTVEKYRPTFTDVNELIKRGEYVGHKSGSFVSGILKRMGFDESKIKIYYSPEELDDVLTKGSANGGIAAAFDEIPYMRLFLAKHCSKYTMVGPTYKTDGFAFVFPRGSALVPDVSRAVLKVTESSKMVDIENLWFGKKTSCPDPSTTFSYNSLGLDSFWGLFLISAIASSLALIIFAAMFIYEHRHIFAEWESQSPKVPLWRKIIEMLKHFNQKDLNSHTFRKSELPHTSANSGIDGMGTVEASQNTNYPPPSPSSFSNDTESNFIGFGEQGSPSIEYGDTSPNWHTPQEIISTAELTDQNKERPITPEIAHLNN